MMSNYILLKNDDGVEAKGIISLAKALSNLGYRIVIIAPEENKSATGMSITLQKELRFTERSDIANQIGDSARVFSLEGSPSDCIIVGLSGALADMIPEDKPMLCISGINIGQNISVDLFHSGTVGAARESGLYGVPSLATSLAAFDESGLEAATKSTLMVVSAILKILPSNPINLMRDNLGNLRDDKNSTDVERLRLAFMRGDLFLNLNTPSEWNGEIKSTSIGMKWYRNALHRVEGKSAYSIDGVEIINQPGDNCDVGAIENRYASLTTCPTWPSSHPLCIDADLIRNDLQSSSTGLPVWIRND